jgi:hypothetical protein
VVTREGYRASNGAAIDRVVTLLRMRWLVFLLALASCRHSVDPNTGGEGEGAAEGEGVVGEGEGEGNGCPTDPVAGLIVPVVDNCTTFHVCGATVTATNQQTSVPETLQQIGTSTADCAYQGAFDAPGTYEIDVGAADYDSFSLSNIAVDGDDCGHAVPRTVTVRLNPTGSCG